MIVHLYKLISGETIIAEFIEQQVVNSQTNARIHLLKRPYVVSKEWAWDGLEFSWINGLADAVGLYGSGGGVVPCRIADVFEAKVQFRDVVLHLTHRGSTHAGLHGFADAVCQGLPTEVCRENGQAVAGRSGGLP